MKAIYTDLHIHTSEDADNLNAQYDITLLVNRIKEFSGVDCSDILVSLTDHNTINKDAYLKLLTIQDINVILGAELHIRNYEKCEPYHCHIFFDISKEDIISHIDFINAILDNLYPKKMVENFDDIPNLEKISKAFDKYDYLMLPHGGQSHRTFEKSFPRNENINFDNALERNIYYNQFDGFTSRSNKGVEETEKYFKKLGINTFINLITCTDNYNPKDYPASKSSKEGEFIPTWINSKPTFQGLRLALSEKTRLFYQINQPLFTSDYIKHVELKNDLIDIDVDLTPGLNVIIGGSSSGKTLLMDSIYNSINRVFPENNPYSKFDVNSIKVINPSGSLPHYINQNYIIKIIDEKSEYGIENIDIIKNTFLSHDDVDDKVDMELNSLKRTIETLFKASSDIETLQKNIRSLKHFPRLVSKNELMNNYFAEWIPNQDIQKSLVISDVEIKRINDTLHDVEVLAKRNPFINADIIQKNIDSILEEIRLAKEKENHSDCVLKTLQEYKNKFDETEALEKQSDVNKRNEFSKLLEYISQYKENYVLFNKSVEKLLKFSFKYNTKPIKSNGHELRVESNFSLNAKIIIDAINTILPSANKIDDLASLTPETLFKDKIDGRQKRNVASKVYTTIEKENKRKFVIITKENKNFETLSPGWKTAVLLDLILGYSEDNAPIFIDQPEDNLATSYINKDLVNAIKRCKERKQLLVISHNATIPMLADAQNIILCQNVNNKIYIRSGAMEESINGKKNIDSIAEITDGGKASVKKRVKKYNLRSFRED